MPMFHQKVVLEQVIHSWQFFKGRKNSNKWAISLSAMFSFFLTPSPLLFLLTSGTCLLPVTLLLQCTMVTLPTQHWLKPPSHCAPRFISNSTPPLILFSQRNASKLGLVRRYKPSGLFQGKFTFLPS